MVLSEWSEGLCCVTKEASSFISESDPQLWKHHNVLSFPATRIQRWQTEDCFVLPLGQVVLTGPELCLPARQEHTGFRTETRAQALLGTCRWPCLCWRCWLGGLTPLCSPPQMAWRWRKWTVKGLGQVLALPPAAVDKSAPTFETRVSSSVILKWQKCLFCLPHSS